MDQTDPDSDPHHCSEASLRQEYGRKISCKGQVIELCGQLSYAWHPPHHPTAS
jgi:hypothetical protein